MDSRTSLNTNTMLIIKCKVNFTKPATSVRPDPKPIKIIKPQPVVEIQAKPIIEHGTIHVWDKHMPMSNFVASKEDALGLLFGGAK